LNGTGARLVAGRLFTEHDDMTAPRVAIVNRMLANQHFLGGNAIGRSIYPGSQFLGGGYRIIGVVDDDRSSVVGGAELPRETAYVSVLQQPPQVVDLVLDGEAAAAGRDAATGAIASVVGPQATIRRIQTMADQMQEQRTVVVWCGAACVVIAILILLLGLVGTVATMTMWAESMAHELALRRAVGAPRWRILVFVFARAMGVGIGGAVFGGYVYAFALAPVLAVSVAHVALPALGTILWIVIPPVLLAVTLGTIPGARFAWGAPAAGLQAASG
jgi:putative ABC transport system permease protein